MILKVVFKIREWALVNENAIINVDLIFLRDRLPTPTAT